MKTSSLEQVTQIAQRTQMLFFEHELKVLKNNGL
jgi:hypothetical protein